jgi:SpoVK/Ycf46/Vps4 family AAA+-type ATPase
MKYFLAEDSAYYTKEEIVKLEKIWKLEKIYLFPDKKELKEIFLEGGSNFAVISPSSPASLDKIFAKNNFFTVIRLPNKFGILTKAEKEMGVTPQEALSQKLGITISKPTVNFSDMAGNEAIKQKVKDVLNKIKTQKSPKGLFFIGPPGTGKSFVAKTTAGELGFYIAEVNLSTIMQRENPIEDINYYFSYFVESGESYVIWIDEIEKMINKRNFASIQVLGALLTRLNEISNEVFGHGTILTIATANNIEELSTTTPELFRKGRFDDIIFIDIPSLRTAKLVLELYIKKEISKFKDIVVPFHFFGLFAKELKIKTIYQSDDDYMGILNKYSDDVKKVFDKRAKYYYLIEMTNIENRDEIEAIIKNSGSLEKELREFYNLLLENYFKTDAKLSEHIYNIFKTDLDNSNNESFKKCIEEYVDIFGIPIEHIDLIMIKTIEKFRDVVIRGSGRGDKFPYVQSEIELLASDLSLKRKSVIEKIGIEKYKEIKITDLVDMSISEMVPLQIPMKKPIEKMIGVGADFITVD